MNDDNIIKLKVCSIQIRHSAEITNDTQKKAELLKLAYDCQELINLISARLLKS